MNRVETELPEFIRGWTAPFHVTMDGIKDANGCWICSATNHKLATQIVELMNYAAALSTPIAAGGGEAKDRSGNFVLGDHVETVKGAKFWGEIVAFDNDAALPGCTVLAIDPDFAGTKHVYPLKQLQLRAIRAALSTAGAAEPVAWSFELARGHDSVSGYCDWAAPQLSFTKPNVPIGAIRNLRALVFASPPSDTEEKAPARDFWLQYDHQAGKWCVENEPPKVTRPGAEVIHTREIS